MSAARSVRRVVPSVETLEGAVFLVHRAFPGPELDRFDPFLLLEEMGPMELGPGEAKGAPDHPGGAISKPLPAGFNAFAYVVEGRGLFGAEGRPARRHELVLFGKDGDAARLEAPADSALRALLVGGRPLDEPVARLGPFVMNTRAELIQAFEDFQSGRFG